MSQTRTWLLVAIAALSLPAFSAWSQQKERAEARGRAAGILVERHETWISVKADGEDEPVKYIIDPKADKKVAESMKGIFDASRVQIAWQKDGDARRLTSIKKQVLKATGTVTGDVVKVYNNFWVEVKPKSGPSDAYAPGVKNFNDEKFMATLRGLKKGDSVTISYTTDFERHRIESLQVNRPRTAPAGKP